jgi:DNA polymerase-3 subunit epsilon
VTYNIGSAVLTARDYDLFDQPRESPGAFRAGAPSGLRREAAELLMRQPLSSVKLIERICRIPGVPVAVADDMAMALFGSSPWFARAEDGTWSLAGAGAERQRPAAIPSSSTPLNNLSYLVVDVETTGHNPHAGHRITEVAAYLVEGDRISCVIDTLVNPRRSIPRFVTALTGISWHMVKDAPGFEECSAQIVSAMEGRVFVGHNVNFDWRFISTEITWCTGLQPVHERLCTVKMARALLPELPRRSLDRVADHFGIAIGARHRAAGDALATARVLQRLIECAGERGIETWGELHDYYSRRGRRRRGGGQAKRTRRRRK